MNTTFSIAAMFLLAVGSLTQSPSNAQAQLAPAVACDAKALASADGLFPYKQRGEFCEGTYARGVSGGLDLLSVTAVPRFSAPRPPSVVLALPRSASVATAMLVGASIPTAVSYRVDRQISGQSPVTWPNTAQEVGLSASDIGWVAYDTSVLPRPAIPVCVEATLGPCETSHLITVIVRPDINVTSLKVTVTKERQTWEPSGPTKELAPDGNLAGLPVSLQVDVSDQPRALRILFVAKAADAGARTLRTSITVKLRP
jgi:hypothetical protein